MWNGNFKIGGEWFNTTSQTISSKFTSVIGKDRLLCHVVCFMNVFQRIGKYNQHSADQLNMEETPVEHLQVIISANRKLQDIQDSLFYVSFACYC